MPHLQSLVINQIIPSVFDAAASLLLVIIIFHLFKVTNPVTRFMFVSVVMLRSFIVLIDTASVKLNFGHSTKPVQFGFRFFDPFGLFSIPDAGPHNMVFSDSAFEVAVSVAFYGIAVFMVLRWIQLFIFLTRLKKEIELDRVEYEWLYSIVDKVTAKVGAVKPRIVITDKFPIVPFSVGLFNPTLVVSPGLLASFSQ
ncbi:MAG: hypothetical protein HY779_06040, partial [Rubrobacteridae bacterium]|nr:hypothetical protein [Rubrobacteridae bacterium]